MTFWKMRIRPLDLDKAFATNLLITTSCAVQVRRVVQETDGTFGTFFVKENLKRLTVHKGIVGEVDFSWSQVIT